MPGSAVRRTLIVLAIVLMLGAAFCIVHGDDPGLGDRAMSTMCCAVVIAMLPLVPFLALLMAGWTSTVSRISIPIAPLLVLEPPPKATRLA